MKAKKTAVKKTKMQVGGALENFRKNQLEKKEKKAYDKYSEARKSGSSNTGKLYDKLVNRQTKSIKAGVNTTYKKGGNIKAKKK